MLSEMGMRSMIGRGDERFGGEDLGRLLREQRRQEASDLERELNIYRSGSAPPTVEGSLNAVGVFSGEFLSEEELLSDPAYHSYYYTHVNLNPRLPPPQLSKEDWRSKQRLQSGSSTLGGIGDRRKTGRVEEVGSGSGSGSLFSMQPGFDLQDRNAAFSTEMMRRGGDGVFGKSHGRRKSFAEILQDDHSLKDSIPSYPSRPASHDALVDVHDPLGSSGTGVGLQNDATSFDSLQHSGSSKDIVRHQSMASRNFPSVIGSSILRSSTPEPHLVARDQNTSLPPAGMNLGALYKNTNGGLYSFNDTVTNIVESEDLLPALSRICLSGSGPSIAAHIPQAKLQQEICDEQIMYTLQGGQSLVKEYPLLQKDNSEHLCMPSMPQSLRSSYHESPGIAGPSDLSSSALRLGEQNPELRRPIAQSSNSYLKTQKTLSALSVGSHSGSLAHYQNVDSATAAFMSYGQSDSQINPASYSLLPNHINNNNLPPLFEYAATASTLTAPGVNSSTLGGGFSSGLSLNRTADFPNLNRPGSNTSVGASAHLPLLDPLYFEYLKDAGYASQTALNFSDLPVERCHSGNSYVNLLGTQKAYLEALLQQQKQYGGSFLGGPKTGASNHGLYDNPSFGLNLQYTGSPIIPASPGGPGSSLRLVEHSMNLPYGMQNFTRGGMSTWQSSHTSNTDENVSSSLLEVFKSNKSRCFELSEIAGHVVEFSSDQYGSRFIQQKLETATAEEKNMVFKEITPRALSLMTDVFGNYVVQKFFEHGTEAQIRELANQLKGHVLALSLQMYGCRVIQKAIEVVSLNQQTEMVKELDGHVMRCVRDQNGNHVIQKCIECIPQDAIQFIISSFYDQVVTLSTHPYGCRVIQRVLEHCHDPETQKIVMNEIMQCVCMLAQDQYGNYVIQHVLEYGKPDERSAVISKLAGLIVLMSQQKFASNVVEKCLTFGSAEERQVLINEMIGSTDENDPLQAMMKDQFANYVVQKVLETCDDQQRELILTRIKVHLTALKKYTYGKHIVARVEKLVAAGERRIGLQFPYH